MPSIIKNTLYSLVLLQIISCSHSVVNRNINNSQTPNMVQSDSSNNLSQLIRSNTAHYWGWMKEQVQNNEQLAPWLKFEGLIMGDPHLGNFTPLAITNLNNQQKIAFLPIDFDDIGEGPLIVDLARFIVATEAITSKVKKKSLVQAYVAGLTQPKSGAEAYFPTLVVNALNTTTDEYKKKVEKFVDKKTRSNGKFKLETDVLEKFETPLAAKVKQKIGTDHVLDIAQKIVTRGGSKSALRLWINYSNQEDQRIIEFKEWQLSGLESYTHQKPILENINSIHKYFWPSIKPENYDLTKIDERLFWIRNKKISFFDIPYKDISDVELIFIKEYSKLCAYVLGQIHGRQSSGKKLLEFINSQNHGSRNLKEALEPYIREYLDFAKEQLDD